jgi:7-carboxy-7-deazaguanine synthase
LSVVAASPSERLSGGATAALRLKITEIFHSIQGEALFSGWPTVFVRLTGCPLRCRYCDTAYAFGGGEWWSVAAIVERVSGFGARHVCVTGGEPLAQARCPGLLTALCDAGFEVCLETGGAHDISLVDARVHRIVDIKTPGSGESARNRLENLELLTPRDALKLVVTSRDDYEWAERFVRAHASLPCPIFLSPSFNEISAADLADWILADRLPVRLQLQIHKLLWGDAPGR